MRFPLRRSHLDRVLRGGLIAAAVAAGSIFLLVFLFLLKEAGPSFSNPGPKAMLTDADWYPTTGSFGMLPMLLATLATAFGGLLLAVPVGVGAAVFARYFAPRFLAPLLRRLMELLAGIPSVVFGLWGLLVLVPGISESLGGPGQSLLAATLVLALMIVPTIALTADAALRAVPSTVLLGATALGLSRGSVVRRVALPTAAAGIRSGILLALARGLGETMAVLMIAGNKVQAPYDLLQPVRTLSANLALELGYASEAHRSVLFFGGLLLTTTVLLSLMPRFLAREGTL
ncbi:MAG: phosphate ABC transporter permease subunit PstC [Planctomycetota bacterium]|nr:phosphate ABC transporter permease subunit PstC [Planctomycetota bacterium]MDA1113309.1 phosphate ABC transporter permease subunit PstC [Planctomycetota bacterium]